MLKHIHILLIAAVFILASCSDKNGDEDAVQAPPSKTIMTINGEEVTDRQFYNYTYFTRREIDPLKVNNEEISQKLLRDFTEHRLLLQEAGRLGIILDPERKAEVDEYIEKMSSGLIEQGYDNETAAEIQEKLVVVTEEALVVQKLLDTITNPSINITEQELKEYFEMKKENLEPKTLAHVMHILVHDEETAEQAVGELKKGVPFSEVAEKHSVSHEKVNGGNLGFIDADDYPDVFKEAFKLKKGQTSGIVQSEYGYHIFKVLEYMKTGKIKFDDMKAELYAELYAIKQEESIRNYIDEIYKKADITVISTPDLQPEQPLTGADSQ
ncbi:peptidylprolyl isomerase [Limisalsivibrio acetivorans]|uniref:peptidylprolyl isomerase n=1 Tax=Limisalsivibrio acetivorans TaxID=1304888 RepID=UPI00138B0AD4|nr:peptidyl-prolyl cis-trans isomerase [Limisalsivibrio acetivorans]